MAIATRQRVDPYEHCDTIHVGLFCHEPGFTGYGNPTNGVVFIGIAPGRDEVKSGRPFTGPSGQLLNSYLDAIGLARDQVYCTNLICWWKDEPTLEEYNRCKPRLLRELAEIKPKLIILMGALVTDYVLGKKLAGTEGSRGSVTWNTEFNAYIMPTYHPAAVLHSGGAESVSGDKGADVAMDIWRDLSKVVTVIKEWPLNDSLQNVEYTIVESREQAQAVLDNLPRSETGIPVAIDVETSSIDEDSMDFTTDLLLCLSIATPDHSWVFPRETLDNLTWPINDIIWTMHNGLFDTQVIKEHLGFWLPIVEDTMLMSYSLDERPGYHRLKPLAREYLGAGWWEVERKKLRGKLHTIPKPALYRYNAYDGGNTARLAVKLKPRQEVDNVRNMYLQLLIPAANVFNRIQHQGIKVDITQLTAYAIKWGQEVIKREQELQEKAFEYGWPRELGPLNFNSPKQVASMIYGVLSLPSDPRSRKVSVDKLNLDRLSGAHPFVDELEEYKHWDKNFTTYVEKLFDHIKKDGKCHSVVKLHGTKTGRLSYTNPALQTIPRPYETLESWAREFRKLRRLFIPDQIDHVVIEADYGKAELWQAYFYSQDSQLRADLESGDYHTVVAMDVLSKQKHEITSDDRVSMKKVNFGVLYGMEAHTMSIRIKDTITVAAARIQGWFNRNSGYKRFLTEIHNRAIDEGEIVTITGRKRRFLFLGGDWDRRALNQAINHPIQSTASDYTLASVIELYPLLDKYDAYIMLSVHDSIIIGCPREHAEAVSKLVHEVMTRDRWFMGMPVDIKIGKSWGTVKKVHSCEDAGECQAARRDGIKHEPTFTFNKVRKLLVA